MNRHEREPSAFGTLFPELAGRDLGEAEANFEGYLGVVLRIYERIRRDPAAYRRFRRLTKKPGHGNLAAGRNPTSSQLNH